MAEALLATFAVILMSIIGSGAMLGIAYYFTQKTRLY